MLVVVFFSPMGVLVFGLYYGFVLVVRKLGLYGCFLFWVWVLCVAKCTFLVFVAGLENCCPIF